MKSLIDLQRTCNRPTISSSAVCPRSATGFALLFSIRANAVKAYAGASYFQQASAVAYQELFRKPLPHRRSTHRPDRPRELMTTALSDRRTGPRQTRPSRQRESHHPRQSVLALERWGRPGFCSRQACDEGSAARQERLLRYFSHFLLLCGCQTRSLGRHKGRSSAAW